MPDIKMIKYHQLPMAAARSLVQKAADDLAEAYDLTSRWVGNTLYFRRSGVEGEMRVSESEIDLEVTLGFLLKAFRTKFVENIEHTFETLLATAHAAYKGGTKQAKPTTQPKTPVKPAKKTRKKT